MKGAVVSAAAIPETIVSKEALPADHRIKKTDSRGDGH
jgi:hypothetical protein